MAGCEKMIHCMLTMNEKRENRPIEIIPRLYD